MSISLSTELMQTPSVRGFLHALLDDLAHRRSLLVLLPASMEPVKVWLALRQELWRRDFHVYEVFLPDLPKASPPAAALGEALGVQWASPQIPRTTANLIASEHLPDVIHLEGFDVLPEVGQVTWMHILTQWAQASQTAVVRGVVPKALCVLTPAASLLSQVPESNVYLSVQWWWGIPSALEINMMCRFGTGNEERGPSIQWREHLVPGLAGNDVLLAEYLWENLHHGSDDLAKRLQSFGETLGWTPTTLRLWGAEGLLTNSSGNHNRRSLAPPARWRLLWAHGALSWTPEYGLELHTAALAMLGRQEDLKHRLWRGQATLLLPLIDAVRLTMCNQLSQRHGQDWPVRWSQPASEEEAVAVRNSPMACQWGHLEWLLRNWPHLRSERPWLPLVSLMRRVRNELAHYRPVTLNDFEGIWREVQRVQRMGVFFPVPM